MALSERAALTKDTNHGAERNVFQHRHYAAIAKIIRDMEGIDDDTRAEMIFGFGVALALADSNFDQERFQLACAAR